VPLASTRERASEVHRDRRVRRLRCADVVNDRCGLARYDSSAPGCRPFRIVALRLAPGSVRVCRLFDRAFIDYDYYRPLTSP
jgi:hypothetical protein